MGYSQRFLINRQIINTYWLEKFYKATARQCEAYLADCRILPPHAVFCMNGRSDSNMAATSSRPRPLVVQLILVAIHLSAFMSPTEGRPRSSNTLPWPSLTSASSSQARESRLPTPSVRWTEFSTAAW